MQRSSKFLAAILVSALISACGSLSGLQGTSSYSCKAPAGVRCDSLSGVYANAVAGNLPSQRSKVGDPVSLDSKSSVAENAAAPAVPLSIPSSAPIRTEPRILRLWIAPYEDTDGDLVDQQFVFLPIDSGRWALEHVRRKIKDKFAPGGGTRASAAVTASAPVPQKRTPPVDIVSEPQYLQLGGGE